MDIEKILQEYRFKKSFVETTQARIEQYKLAILHPEMWNKDYIPPSREIGMPGKPHGSGVPRSPVELFVTNKELNEDIIKEWIRDDESRIFKMMLEVEQLEKAMLCLTKQEKFIIECKYFDRMFWKNIEIIYNQQFRQQNYITVSGIRKINDEALNKLEMILEPFYNQFIA